MVLLAADVKEDGVAWGKFRVVGRMVRVGAVRTEGTIGGKENPSAPSSL